MSTKELRLKSLSELDQALKDQVKTRFKLRMQHGNGQLAKTDQLTKCKKTIARIKTLMTEKQREGAAQ
ncbi:MAG: 50S ribosomal protein L29 [Gammaproteobacteria bacterium]